jgi:hypothetical protein
MVLAAVEAMAKADAIGRPRRLDADVAAQATAREPFHAAPPRMAIGSDAYAEPRCG